LDEFEARKEHQRPATTMTALGMRASRRKVRTDTEMRVKDATERLEQEIVKVEML
jgi:hypothetical protein